MNIIFADKLTSDCFLHLMQYPQHQDLDHGLLPLVIWKLTSGGWGQLRDEDYGEYPPRRGLGAHIIDSIPTEDNIEPETTYRPARPSWSKQRGRVARIRIHVETGFGALSMHNGLPIAKEFNWVVESADVDKYGRPAPDTEWRREMNGGFINHGTFKEPSWSSHT